MKSTEEAGGFRVHIFHRWQFFTGLALIVAGFLIPLAINEVNMGVKRFFLLALHEESLNLITAALLLVVMNFFRALPHYIGTYWLVDSLDFRLNGRRLGLINDMLVIVVLLLAYRTIDAVNGIHYDFGLPAGIMTGIIILYDSLHYNYVSLFKRTLFISVSLMAPQFLDVMPAASPLPVGRGEISHDIKMAAEVLELESELNFMAATGLIVVLLVAVMIFFLLRDENELRQVSVLKETNARMQMVAYQNEVQNRALKEAQYLVHDLKSPLSVVQTLEGVLRLEAGESRPESREIFDRMEKALDQLSVKISQVLTMDQKDSFSVGELFHDVMSQISIESYASYVETKTDIPDASFYANQVLLSRALVNLVQNAVHAVPEGREPHICIGARRQGSDIVLTVTDNGKGVSPEEQARIWEHGYSGKKSSGMGLAFIQLAVTRSGGRIEVKSDLDKGTEFSLFLPEEGGADDQ